MKTETMIDVALATLMTLAFIVLVINLVFASCQMQAEFPPREKFSKNYETVKVLRYEDTVCYGCHN